MRQIDADKVVQALLLAPEGLGAPEIARQLGRGISQSTLWRALNKLRAEGRVVMEGAARSTRYHATERGDLPALRSLRLHQAVARLLIRDPSLIRVASERLERLRKVNPHGRVYHETWASLIEGPRARLLRVMTEPSEQAASLRQESPFTTLVPERERLRVFKALRAA
jgi:biotin operon repressor